MRVLKVTIGASGASPITTNPALYASIICFQNQGAAAMSIGDNEVLVNGGITLASGTPGGSGTFQMNFARGTHLVDWWVAGTAGQVMIVLYESAT